MSIYAALNPSSWFMSPYFGALTLVIMWFWFWNSNIWNVVRYNNETWEQDKFWWILRTTSWAIILNPVMLFFVYMSVLIFVKVASIKISNLL
jgi:hypothetical protein